MYRPCTPAQSLLNMVWGKWAWLQQEFLDIAPNGSSNHTKTVEDTQRMEAIVALEEELDDFQPLYRNPLLQRLYATDCANDVDDDSVYAFVSIDHGHWIPSAQYEVEARDFSWADLEQMDAVEEQQLAQTLNADDMTDGDREQQAEMQQLVQQEIQEQAEQPPEEHHSHKLRKQVQQAAQAEAESDAAVDADSRAEQEQQAAQAEEESDAAGDEIGAQASLRRLMQFGRDRGPFGRGPPLRMPFDPRSALPNPANIITPNARGDEGGGDAEYEALKNVDGDKLDALNQRMPRVCLCLLPAVLCIDHGLSQPGCATCADTAARATFCVTCASDCRSACRTASTWTTWTT